MEYKMFGPGGFPGESFRRGLKILLTLSEDDWEALERWFLTTPSFDSDTASSSVAFSNSSLTPDRAAECIEVLKFILEAWHLHNLELSAIERDLMLLGRTSEEIERLSSLLKRLEPVKQKAWRSYMRSESENAVLPTMEDIDVVCDLRPIFQDYVYPLPEADTGQHKKLLGFTYVVLVELQTEDSMGRKQRIAFQMTEERLGELEAAIRRATDQLDILKARTHGLSVSD